MSYDGSRIDELCCRKHAISGAFPDFRIPQDEKVEKQKIFMTLIFRLLVVIVFPFLVASCTSMQSTVESTVDKVMGGEGQIDETYAGRQHFPVTPQEAVDFLTQVAPRHGWEVVSTGDEYDAYRKRGKFFRLQANKPTKGKSVVSGVFYAERTGAYVRVSENNGLPESLVEPLIAEIKEQKGYLVEKRAD